MPYHFDQTKSCKELRNDLPPDLHTREASGVVDKDEDSWNVVEYDTKPLQGDLKMLKAKFLAMLYTQVLPHDKG